MRRFSTAFVMIVLAAGTVAAQESGFRYASDPFSGDEAATTKTVTVPKDDEQATADNEGSYQSYEGSTGKNLVQKKAMYRSEQRQLRIASRRWYGFSQSRPMVLANPYMNTYTPIWGNRTASPYYAWYGNVWY